MFNKEDKQKKDHKTPESFKNKKTYDETIFEKRKNHLLKYFFIFWAFVLLILIILSICCHSLGIMVFLIPLFLTYVRLSRNNEHWKENFDIIMSNKFAHVFLYSIYFLSIIFILIIIYEFFKINFNFHLDFMEFLIKWLIIIFSKY